MSTRSSLYKTISWFTFSLLMTACNVLEKGYDALAEYDYFTAKKRFEKSLKKNTSPAAFGLSQIYGRNDNPFSNLDSAYHYSLLSVETYLQLEEKKRIAYKRDIGLTLKRMELWREAISVRFFEMARSKNSIQGYMEFASNHPWSSLKDSSIYLRDSLAFDEALKWNNSRSYGQFITHYDESVFISQARLKLDEAQYTETIVEGDIDSYIRFLELFPSNYLSEKAHRNIYKLSTEENTEQSYSDFIENYPHNPYVNEAWLNLYRIATSDYTAKTINAFDQRYPDFPFHDLIIADLELVTMNLIPYRLNDLFGYMDVSGIPLIPPSFDFAGVFSNGLAVVSKDGVYGYIDKNKELVIDYQFDDAGDFDQGRAIIEQNGALGVIDRTGKYILPPVYDEIGPISDGLMYAAQGDHYGYYDTYGYNRIPMKYEEAYSFSNGLAKVIFEGQTQLIDTDGGTVLRAKNADLRKFSDSLYIYELRDSVNLISLTGDFILDRFAHRIGPLSENRALIQKNGKYGYINRYGEEMIPIKFLVFPNLNQFSSFENGHVRIRKVDLYGMIDSLGQQIFPALFEDIGDFGGLTPVTKGKQWGYADPKVKLQIPYQYDYAYPFIDDRAIVVLENQYGIIDMKGEWVATPNFEDIKQVSSKLFIIKKNGLFGLMNSSGEIQLPAMYRRYLTLDNDMIQLEAEDEISYFVVSKQQLISLQKDDE